MAGQEGCSYSLLWLTHPTEYKLLVWNKRQRKLASCRYNWHQLVWYVYIYINFSKLMKMWNRSLKSSIRQICTCMERMPSKLRNFFLFFLLVLNFVLALPNLVPANPPVNFSHQLLKSTTSDFIWENVGLLESGIELCMLCLAWWALVKSLALGVSSPKVTLQWIPMDSSGTSSKLASFSSSSSYKTI